MHKLIAAAAVSGLALFAGAQAADVTSEAGAKIVAPLQVENITALYFGTIAPSLTQADGVLVAPDGSKECGQALTCLSDDHTAAAFQVSGADGFSYTIDLPNEAIIRNANGDDMKIENFAGSKGNGTLANGQDDFTVGGYLNVAANQPEGDYTGTFVVTVEYQ
jgi:hypothetical protein